MLIFSIKIQFIRATVTKISRCILYIYSEKEVASTSQSCKQINKKKITIILLKHDSLDDHKVVTVFRFNDGNNLLHLIEMQPSIIVSKKKFYINMINTVLVVIAYLFGVLLCREPC